mmetsp:Transcript_98196/g.174810  ORF Transcript_98196/g.174810 Transcript_98196/m.174810 type:complete len:327 (+) Transcript_98196:40-1020(+)
MSGACNVIVIRHGQRLDEADRVEWRKIRTPENQDDPPLTEEGWKQAAAAGAEVRKALQHHQLASLIVYSSPTARTLSTAAAVAMELGTDRVTPAHALNCCAAAQHHGVESKRVFRDPSASTMGNAQLACWPPVGVAKHIDGMMRRQSGFVKLVKELAESHNADESLVLVTHREGIWELQQHVGLKTTVSYCSISYLTYDFSTQKLRKRTLQGAAPSPVPKAMLEAPEVTLQTVLDSGSGPVVVDRHGRGGQTSTRLWKTPGVRGAWVEDGCVRDGEEVELCSPPQPSDGNEGEFALIRRKNGVQGWVKVCNLRLAGTRGYMTSAGC